MRTKPYDIVLVDEAHLLLTRKTQAFNGEQGQLAEIMKYGKVVVAMFHRKQIMNAEQYLSKEEIDKYENTAKREGTNTYAFTIKANGTLTIHVTDTGIPETGVQVIGAKFVRTDSTGNILSEEITTDTDGNNKAIENDVELADGTIFPFKYVLDTKRIPHILGIQRAEYLSERSYY